jgi:hypothetical protein
MRFYFVFSVLLAGLVALAGCSGPREAAEEPSEPAVELSDVETFDPGPYQIEAVEQPSFELTHRVPESLMAPADSSNAEYTESMVVRSGYRIQIFSGESKSNADDRLQQALTWWEEQGQDMEGAASVFSGSLPVRMVYNAPYYKVRVGDFVDRKVAQKSLKIIRKRFPDAWIVPDQVEVYQ